VQWARVATACDGEDDGLELEACLIPGTLTPIFTTRLQASIRYSDIGRETIFNTKATEDTPCSVMECIVLNYKGRILSKFN
jgi:hypothetical protein